MHLDGDRLPVAAAIQWEDCCWKNGLLPSTVVNIGFVSKPEATALTSYAMLFAIMGLSKRRV